MEILRVGVGVERPIYHSTSRAKLEIRFGFPECRVLPESAWDLQRNKWQAMREFLFVQNSKASAPTSITATLQSRSPDWIRKCHLSFLTVKLSADVNGMLKHFQ